MLQERSAPTHGPKLPQDWDRERDLLVWVAGEEAEPPETLRGPRAWHFSPSGATASAAASAAADPPARLRSHGQLFQTILALSGPTPAHALVHRGPGASLEDHHAAANTVRNALRSRAMQRKTVEESGVTWLLQGIANLPSLARHPSIASLERSFAGVPCVLVSPGPSLAKNVARLPELAGRALIVSGTHALHALRAAGVAPHVVVCADPGDLARHWDGIDASAIEAFVVGATCRAEAFAVPARRHFAFAGNGSSDEWLFRPLGENPVLATGGSVSCSQLSLALYLGCDPIVFVGQDLSFTERFYAASGLDGDALVERASDSEAEFVLVKAAGAQGPGTVLDDGRVRFTIPQRALEVPGWSGGSVRTTPQLKSFLDWFEAVLPGLGARARIVNCTEGGARIAGIEHRPLAEVSAGWTSPIEVGTCMDGALGTLDAGARRRALHGSTARTLTALESCVRLSGRCRGLLPRASEPRTRAELERTEKELARALRDASLVSLVAQKDIAEATEHARRARTLEENLAAARTLYAVVERAGRLLDAPLRAALRALAD